MEEVNLEQYGFIQSVNVCIELLREFGDKVTPEKLDIFLGKHTKEYMNSREFLSEVVSSVINGGSSFLQKMEELYKVKDEVINIINANNIHHFLEAVSHEEFQKLMNENHFLEKLAWFCLEAPRFRDFIHAYTKAEVGKAIINLDLKAMIMDIIRPNADEFAKLVLDNTKKIQAQAEASLLVIQTIEQYCIIKQRCWVDPDSLHHQNYPKG